MSNLYLEEIEEIEGLCNTRVNVGDRTCRPGWRHGVSPSILRASASREKPAKPAEKPVAKSEEIIPERSQLGAISVDFHDYPSMVQALRAIKDHISISNDDLDALCQFGSGHTDKLLGPTSVRGFARLSLDAMFWALAIKGTFTIDLNRAKDMQPHWEKRCAANTRIKPSRISKAIIESAKHAVLSEMSRKGWETRRRNRQMDNQKGTST